MKKTNEASLLPARHPLAQAVSLTLVLGAGSAQAAIFNVTNNNDSGAGSLRDAIDQANTTAGADHITFNAELGTITLTSGQIDITETLTITGQAAGQVISGNNASRIFAVTTAGAALTLESLTLTGGYTSADAVSPATCANDTGEGGAVCALGNVTLTNSTISGNSTRGRDAKGGGLFVFSAVSSVNITLTNSTVSGNTTAGRDARGGGFFVFSAVSSVNTTLTNSTVSGNTTAGNFANGGGLFVNSAVPSSNTTLTNSIVSGNTTAGLSAGGGGLCVVRGTTTLINSTVSGNSTTGDSANGGGLFVSEPTLTNSTVSGNTTAGRDAKGGGLYVVAGDATLTNSTVSGNTTAGRDAKGGGLFVSTNTTLTNSTVSGNSTAGDSAGGGGLFVSDITLTNSTVSGNGTTGDSAGGGGLLVNFGYATLVNSTVTKNQASVGAGGIEIIGNPFFPYDNTSLTLTNALLAGNSGPEGNFNPQIVGIRGSIAVNASHSLFGDDPPEVNGTNNDNVFTDTPRLETLADNGCAAPAGAADSAACVQTHALLRDSPALDAGSNPNNLPMDQRGASFPRVVGTAADIGAFESKGGSIPPPAPVPAAGK